jgi:hypothetical protein
LDGFVKRSRYGLQVRRSEAYILYAAVSRDAA